MSKTTTSAISLRRAVLTVVCLCSAGTAIGQDAGVLYGVRAINKELVIRSLDLGSSQGVQEKGRLTQPLQQRLVAIFQNPDRGVGLVSTVTGAGAGLRSVVRMIGTPEHLVDTSTHMVAGLPVFHAISSVVVPRSGMPLGLVARHTDTPPFWLFNVELDSGQLKVIDIPLGRNTRYSLLTQCQNGIIYAISIAPEGGRRLVQLDIDRLAVTPIAKLELEGSAQLLIRDLACGPSGTLYGLAESDHSGTNSLLRVDSATGKITPLQKFDVDHMVFVH